MQMAEYSVRMYLAIQSGFEIAPRQLLDKSRLPNWHEEVSAVRGR